MREHIKIDNSRSIFSKFFLLIKKNALVFTAIIWLLISLFVFVVDLKYPKLFSCIKNSADFIYANDYIYSLPRFIGGKPEGNKTQESKAELEVCKLENNNLKKLLNFIKQEDTLEQRFSTTRVISNPENHQLIIGIDSKSCIKKDQLVVNEKGLVGKITEVNNGFARVMFLTHPLFKMPVLSAKNQHQFVASGMGVKALKPIFLQGEPEDKEIILSTIGATQFLVGRFDQKAKTVIPFNQLRKINFVCVITA